MPDKFTVRVATPEDRPAVRDLLAASFPVLMRPSYSAAMLADVLPLMTRANPALLASGTYYVAETVDGEIVGCGGWTREHPGTGVIEPGLGHIRHFATHPDWTKRGIGRAIYDRCEEDARASGIRRFQCYSSLNAEAFYAAVGFKAVKRIDVPMREGLKLPAVLMERVT